MAITPPSLGQLRHLFGESAVVISDGSSLDLARILRASLSIPEHPRASDVEPYPNRFSGVLKESLRRRREGRAEGEGESVEEGVVDVGASKLEHGETETTLAFSFVSHRV